MLGSSNPRSCFVKSDVPFGVYISTLSDVRTHPSRDVVLTFSTPLGDIVRHSPPNGQGKHADLIRCLLAPQLVPRSILKDPDKTLAVLQNVIGKLFLVSYAPGDGGDRRPRLSAVPYLVSNSDVTSTGLAK